MSEFPFEGSENFGSIETYWKRIVIGDIQPDSDMVQVVGYAKKVNPSQEFLIDDGTGNIQVRNIPEQSPKIEENKVYRICGKCSVDAIGTHFLAADVIQALEKLNLELYKKAIQLLKQIL